MFDPISTGRLLIRPFRAEDASAFADRRNDVLVAEYQSWEVPYTREQATQLVSQLLVMDGPENDEWWMAVVCIASSGEAVGDVSIRLSWDSRTAEVGYTFARERWGRGYAREALEALIGYLFDDLNVTRVFATLHPDNVASAMLLERVGLLFEGHTISSYWDDDVVSDDWIYGATRPTWETWCDRPRSRPEAVRFVEVTVDNVAAVSRVITHKTQERFVAPIERSFTDALFPPIVNGDPVVPRMHAVEADGEFVGFVMMTVGTYPEAELFLWRLLIDRVHQRRGIGGRVLALLSRECAAAGGISMVARWAEGKGSPRPFFLSQGFVPTGRHIEGETEARMECRPP